MHAIKLINRKLISEYHTISEVITQCGNTVATKTYSNGMSFPDDIATFVSGDVTCEACLSVTKQINNDNQMKGDMLHG